MTSLTGYIIRAFREWCLDNDLTPQIVIEVDDDDTEINVPRSFLQGKQMVLNISPQACGRLDLGNEAIAMETRMAGKVENLWIPIRNVRAIFAKETGAGIPFEQTPRGQGAPSAAKARRSVFTKVK